MSQSHPTSGTISLKANPHFFSQMNFLFCCFFIKYPIVWNWKVHSNHKITCYSQFPALTIWKRIILNQSDVIDSEHTPINLVHFWSIVYKSLILKYLYFPHFNFYIFCVPSQEHSGRNDNKTNHTLEWHVGPPNLN